MSAVVETYLRKLKYFQNNSVMDIITASLLVVLISIVFMCLYSRPTNFPPGPRGHPIIGFALKIKKINRGFHFTMKILSEKYGSIIGMYFGFAPIVIVTGYDAVTEVLRRPEFDGRNLKAPAVLPKSQTRKGIINSDGDSLIIQRRFCIRHLRDFGFGKSTIGGIIQEEAIDLFEIMKRKSSESHDSTIQIRGLFNVPLFNVLWALVAGDRYSRDNPKLKELMKIAEHSIHSNGVEHVSGVLTFLSRIFPKYFKLKERQYMITSMTNFFNESIDEHESTHDPQNPRDLMDTYITQMKNDEGDFSRENLLAICGDFFHAGAETTSTFLSFMVLHMLRNKDVQKKVQQEIDQVVGRNRLPTLDDKNNLVYTNAMICEVCRISPPGVMTIPHRAMQETQLKGYTIPKDTILVLSIYSVHMDKEYWGDPEVFRPERFIDSNGKLRKDDHLIIFGIGKRSCLGETLARQSSFLFTALLLHTFDLKAEPDKPMPDPVNVSSVLTLRCPRFSFTATPRD